MKNLILRKAAAFLFAAPFFGMLAAPLLAQPTTESSNPPVPLDDITFRFNLADHRVLPYQPVREADIFWEKRVWRVIDVREKLNAPFANAVEPFFKILTDAIGSEKLTAYSVEDDHFSKQLGANAIQSMLSTTDTVPIFDLETGRDTFAVVQNVIDFENVKRFRIKEVWFFDKNIGAMKCRILGIAPLINVIDKTTGEFRYEKALFWVHYPSARETLARHHVANDFNDAAPMSWEDIFEMRRFAATIYKESNIQDRKLGDYLTGRDALVEGAKINEAIFNFESDLWQW